MEKQKTAKRQRLQASVLPPHRANVYELLLGWFDLLLQPINDLLHFGMAFQFVLFRLSQVDYFRLLFTHAICLQMGSSISFHTIPFYTPSHYPLSLSHTHTQSHSVWISFDIRRVEGGEDNSSVL